jgi:hypothetical protein
MFQVAFGDPDKSDSYGRKKKEEERRKKKEGRWKMEDGRWKMEKAIDRIGKVQLRTSSPSGSCYFNKKLCLEKINIS